MIPSQFVVTQSPKSKYDGLYKSIFLVVEATSKAQAKRKVDGLLGTGDYRNGTHNKPEIRELVVDQIYRV